MNIKNRIIKLEKSANPTGFCNCKDVSKYELFCQDLSEGGANDAGPILRGDLVPETCSNCSRPIDKQVFILSLVDETTKERFPDEWREHEH